MAWWTGGWDIGAELNKRAQANGLAPCFISGVGAEQVAWVYADKNAVSLLSVMLPSCFDKNDEKSMSINDFNHYYGVVKELYQESITRAQRKTNNIYKISKIGMYSDGIDENGPFDLISDLRDIDDIIFSQEFEYDAGYTLDLKSMLTWERGWGLFNPNGLVINTSGKKSQNSSDTSNQNDSGWTGSGNTNQDSLTWNTLDENICLDDSTSGLDLKSLTEILKNNTSTPPKNTSSNASSWNNQSSSSSENNGFSVLPVPDRTYRSTAYKKENDNKVWPCNTFFCIIIDFVTYPHNLLGWSGGEMGIQQLIERSNEHLKKFASTSLIQSKMTTNNYELGLKDLNLPDLFHVWVQVSYKPVPLLKTAPGEEDTQDDDFVLDALLTRYYANLGLDYERRNDISLFKAKEKELKNILDTQETNITWYATNTDEQNAFERKIALENNYLSQKVIEPKVAWDAMNDFYDKYMELESFTRAIMDYAIQVKWIIGEMNKIPQGW